MALLTFVIGVTGVTLWYLYRPSSLRAADEKDIAETVFRYGIKNSEELEKNNNEAIFCLSRGENADPSDEFMRRFMGYTFRLRKLSQCEKQKYGATDKQTGKQVVILEIKGIKWVSRNEAKVGACQYSWAGQFSFDCSVMRGYGSWMVKSCSLHNSID